MPPRRTTLLAVAGAAALAAAGPAHASSSKTSFVVHGAGFGHGVGMSQYGAYGYAQHGVGYASILRHYYTGTRLGTLTSTPTVSVLLRSSHSAAFTGAAHIGNRTLSPGKVYSVEQGGSGVVLRSPKGHALVQFAGAARVTGPAGSPVKLMGAGPNGVQDGLFRGALLFTPAASQLLVINALGLEDYVRGVVGGESPSSWPIEALKAQAVAARTYAITTNAGGAQGFTQYADTRSQVYEGVAAETTATDTAVASTAHQVVTYLGKPITTYFFSTSGGETEDVQNSFLGAAAVPYLVGVRDPYDGVSPKHRWTFTFTMAQAARRLGGLVQGRFKGIEVLKRGVSPRVVSAEVLGSRGTTTVTGPDLRKRLGLYDTWATFSAIGAKVTRRKPVAALPADPGESPSGGAGDGTTTDPGGAAPRAVPSIWQAALLAAADPDRAALLAAARPTLAALPQLPARSVLSGTVQAASAGQHARLQRRTLLRWHTIRRLRIGAHGAYRTTLPTGGGTYRVVWRGLPGPAVGAR